MGAKSWFLRDLRKRASAVDVEVTRNAYLSIARNQTLPAHLRHKAQLALNNYNGGEGRMVSIRNRCNETGRGLGECLGWAGPGQVRHTMPCERLFPSFVDSSALAPWIVLANAQVSSTTTVCAASSSA